MYRETNMTYCHYKDVERITAFYIFVLTKRGRWSEEFLVSI